MSLADGPGGEPNGSYQFHGKRSYIEFPNNGNLTVKHSITMLCWVFFSSEATGPLFSYGNTSVHFVSMYINQNKLKGRFTADSDNHSRRNVLQPGPLPLGQWHYVGASYDNKSGHVSLWVNGTLSRQVLFGTVLLLLLHMT